MPSPCPFRPWCPTSRVFQRSLRAFKSLTLAIVCTLSPPNTHVTRLWRQQYSRRPARAPATSPPLIPPNSGGEAGNGVGLRHPPRVGGAGGGQTRTSREGGGG